MSVFVKPSSDLYALTRVEPIFYPGGGSVGEHLGDVESAVLRSNFTEIERNSKNFGARTTTRSDIIQRSGSLEMALLQFTDRVREIMFMGAQRNVVYAAEAAGLMEAVVVPANGIIRLPKQNVEVASVTPNGGGVALAEDQYRVDSVAGFVQVFPGGTYDIAWTSAETTRKKIGGFSNSGARGSLVMRGVNDVGLKTLVTVHDLEFRLTGDIPLVGADDYDQVTVQARMYPDLTQADPRDQLFTVEVLDDVA